MKIPILIQGIIETGQDTADKLVEIPSNISVVDMIVDSGWLTWVVLIPLFGMSVYSIYIFVERYMTLTKAAKEEKYFMEKIKDYVHDGKLDAAKNLCATTENPIARMIEKGISRIGKPMKDISASIENVGKLEVYKLENRLSSLASISGAAPMIGFLGTVVGMIKVFSDLKQYGTDGNVLETLSGGIMTAMITTVAGLIVGIIAYLAYNFLIAKVSQVIHYMEGSSLEFLDILEEPGK